MIFDRFYHILKVKDHKICKPIILNEISKHDYQIDNDGFENSFISNTDWETENMFPWYNFCFSPRDKKRFYNFFYKKYKKIPALSNCWFNQYNPYTGSEHPPHNHDLCDFVMVYYVELENSKLRTILENPKNNKKVIPNCNEGDVLIFSSNIVHSSPKNFYNSRKTIISFNISLFDDAR